MDYIIGKEGQLKVEHYIIGCIHYDAEVYGTTSLLSVPEERGEEEENMGSIADDGRPAIRQ